MNSQMMAPIIANTAPLEIAVTQPSFAAVNGTNIPPMKPTTLPPVFRTPAAAAVRVNKLAMQLRDFFRMFENNLRHKCPGLNAATTLEFEEVAFSANYRALFKPLKQPWRRGFSCWHVDQSWSSAATNLPSFQRPSLMELSGLVSTPFPLGMPSCHSPM